MYHVIKGCGSCDQRGEDDVIKGVWLKVRDQVIKGVWLKGRGSCDQRGVVEGTWMM